MPAYFDDDEWPVLSLRQTGSDEVADIAAMLAGLTRRLARGRCAVLFDTLGTHYPSLSQAQEYARMEGAWLLENRALISKHVVGVAFVMNNPAVRFILSSVLLIAPLPVPHLVCAESAEGREYCRGQLRRPSLRPTR